MRSLALSVLLLAFAATLLGVSISARGNRSTQALMPDMDIVTPQGILVRQKAVAGKRRFFMGFISAANNVGQGPMILRARRASTEDEMVGDQVLMHADGSETVVSRVATLHYNIDPTHEHWHVRRFMTYELRRASDYRQVVVDQKAGFCLGDRMVAKGKYVPPRRHPRTFRRDCMGKKPDALSVEEGISVGWGDDYTQFRDGQEIDVTHLSAGNYLLVHRVNADRRLREARFGNNASSLLLKVTWPGGPSRAPRFDILAACSHTARCTSGTYFDPL